MPGPPPRSTPASPPSATGLYFLLILMGLVAVVVLAKGDAGIFVPTLLILLIGAVTFLFVLLYVVAPLKFRRTFWASSAPTFHPIVPGDPGVAEWAGSSAGDLRPLGFADRGEFYVDDSTDSASAVIGVREDPASRTVVKRVDVFSRAGVPIEASVAIVTRFADETEILTTNSPRPPLTPIPPGRRAHAFPGVRDPARLLALHRRAIIEAGEFSSRVTEVGPDPAAFLLEEIAQELAHQARAGYLRLDEGSGVYRATFRGAYLMIWKHLWPIGPLRGAARRRRARRLLRAWEGPGAGGGLAGGASMG